MCYHCWRNDSLPDGDEIKELKRLHATVRLICIRCKVSGLDIANRGTKNVGKRHRTQWLIWRMFLEWILLCDCIKTQFKWITLKLKLESILWRFYCIMWSCPDFLYVLVNCQLNRKLLIAGVLPKHRHHLLCERNRLPFSLLHCFFVVVIFFFVWYRFIPYSMMLLNYLILVVIQLSLWTCN